MLSVTETGRLPTLCMARIILLFSVTDDISCSLCVQIVYLTNLSKKFGHFGIYQVIRLLLVLNRSKAKEGSPIVSYLQGSGSEESIGNREISSFSLQSSYQFSSISLRTHTMFPTQIKCFPDTLKAIMKTRVPVYLVNVIFIVKYCHSSKPTTTIIQPQLNSTDWGHELNPLRTHSYILAFWGFLMPLVVMLSHIQKKGVITDYVEIYV